MEKLTSTELTTLRVLLAQYRNAESCADADEKIDKIVAFVEETNPKRQPSR